PRLGDGPESRFCIVVPLVRKVPAVGPRRALGGDLLVKKDHLSLQDPPGDDPGSSPRAGDARAARRGSGRRTISLLTGTTAAIPLLALVAVLVVCIVEAWPAIRVNGFG